MTRPGSSFFLLAVVLSLSTMPVLGHHSFGAEFDATKPITITGVITKIEWTNPHAFIYVDVNDPKLGAEMWKFEGYPPSVLYRSGWSRTTIKPGDTITVSGFRSRDGSNYAHSREITLSSGKKLFFGPPVGTGGGGDTPAVDVR